MPGSARAVTSPLSPVHPPLSGQFTLIDATRQGVGRVGRPRRDGRAERPVAPLGHATHARAGIAATPARDVFRCGRLRTYTLTRIGNALAEGALARPTVCASPTYVAARPQQKYKLGGPRGSSRAAASFCNFPFQRLHDQSIAADFQGPRPPIDRDQLVGLESREMNAGLRGRPSHALRRPVLKPGAWQCGDGFNARRPTKACSRRRKVRAMLPSSLTC